MPTTSITAGGRRLSVTCDYPAYIDSLAGMNGDIGPIAKAVGDLPGGSTFLDVGANIGVTSMIMAAIRPDCKIVAFEPVPQNANALRANAAANGFANITTVQAGVSDEHGYLELTDNGPWSIAIPGGAARARTVKLDDYADPAVRFVKIDVEGFEPKVLTGARKLLLANRPLVLMEFNAWTLMFQHCVLMTFAEFIWSHFEVLGEFHADTEQPRSATPADFLHSNMMLHHCVSDILLRPRLAMPEAFEMTDSIAARHLRAERLAPRRETAEA